MSNAPEVVTFGEVLVRMSAMYGLGFEQLTQIQPYVGGAEANMAVGLSRLGHRVRHVTVLPDNDLGEGALGELRRHGVDTSAIIKSAGRMGLYFLTPGAIHRPADIFYDRKGSAFADYNFEALDWNALLSGAKWLHVSGVTAALGPNTYAAAKKAMTTARELGLKVTYDGNYRPKLWAEWHADAPALIKDLMGLADMIFGNYRDMELIFGTKFTSNGFDREREAAHKAFTSFPNLTTLVATQREVVSVDHNRLSGHVITRTQFHISPVYEVGGIVDRIGGGDAFAAGFYDGLLSHVDLKVALDRAMACACLKHAQPGDLCLITRSALNGFFANDGLDVKR